jgi:hypothetical protein
MGLSRLLPQSKKLKVLVMLAAVASAPLVLYGALMALHTYQAWRLSTMLNSLEAVRVGDPAAGVLQTMSGGCTIERRESEYMCQIVDLPLQFRWLEGLVWKLPDEWRTSDTLDHIGLRGSYLSVSALIDQEHVQRLSVMLIVIGRYESLGSRWEIADRIPQHYYEEASLGPDDRRTYMTWFHITSIPPGEGFRVYATPVSTAEELRARHVNSRCLFSLRGCDGLCELLPDAVPVLNERKRGWGGCCSVPRSKCDLKYDECRNGFVD